jgi:hypothetical protein
MGAKATRRLVLYEPVAQMFLVVTLSLCSVWFATWNRPRRAGSHR